MSTSGTQSTPVVRVTAVTLSSEPANLKSTKRLNYDEIRIGSQQYKLIRDGGYLRQQFTPPIELTPTYRVALCRKIFWILGFKPRHIDTQHLFASALHSNQTQELSVIYDNVRITFSCKAQRNSSSEPSLPGVVRSTEPSPTKGNIRITFSRQAQSNSSSEHYLSGDEHPTEPSPTKDNIQTESNSQSQTSSDPRDSPPTGALHPTTRAILNDCPRFRILVIGKSGVGKSSLINIVFGIDEALPSDLKRGAARIEVPLTSSVNPLFVLHDSLGFEPGDNDKYEDVKKFIREKQGGQLKDQLHAIWFCIQAPREGDRLLEVVAEDFFKSKRETLGTVPIVVVFTKLDQLVNDAARKLVMPKQGKLGKENITKQARSEAVSTVERRHGEIDQLAGEPIPYAIVSKNDHYKDTLSTLIQLTYHLVGTNESPDAHIASMVTMMAQRIDPHLKIQGSIAVGRRRYWMALRASPDFTGHSILECLSVIHTDIVATWNFYDPGCYLRSDKFKELVINMAQDMQVPAVSNRDSTLGGDSLTSAVSKLIATITDPAAPIIMPVVAVIAAIAWIIETYHHAKIVQQRFIAYIVDLTHIMETLLILTGGKHERLTRRIIKFAYRTYQESDVMAQAHSRIQAYRDLDGRDAALEMFESLINPEPSGSSDLRSYYEAVRNPRLGLGAMNLGRDEDW